MAHPNEDLVRKGYQAFATGDLDTLTELFADDIQWHVPGRNQISGDLKGREEVFANFAKLAELTGGTFKIEVHDVIANDEHAIGMITATGSRGGKSLTDNQVHVFHISGGKVTEFWGHPGDQHATDDFLG